MSHRRVSTLVLSAFALALIAPVALAPTAQAQSGTYAVVADFTDGPEGGYPIVTMIQAADGNYYGADSYGGTNGTGVVFKVTPGGTLTGFYNPPSGAPTPATPLTQGADGNFYGVLSSGGKNGFGSIFKLTAAGVLTTIHDFSNAPDGSYASGPLVQGSDGNFYGTASQGGNLSDCPGGFAPNGCGTIFKITPSGTFSVVYTFTGAASDGGFPSYGLVQGDDGNFYGTTANTVFQVTTAGKIKTIATSNFGTDGAYILGPLVEGTGSIFYGTNGESGASGYGTVFSASVASGYKLLYTFTGQADGGAPLSGITLGTDGNLYGTTSQGGNLGCAAGFGCGSIYQITPGGKFTSLYTFGTQADGILGGPALNQGSSGDFYGTAGNGGTSSNCGDGCGTVFSFAISPALVAPVQLSLSSSSVNAGTPYTLTWKANDAVSTTAQQCYAFIQGGKSGAGNWTGKQTGTYNSSTHVYSGSASLTATTAGSYTLALTCGGTVSGFATVTVSGSSKPASTTALTITPTSLSVGQSTTLKATVTGSSGTPSGSVTFSADGAALATVNLNGSGIASLTATSNGLPPATYPVIATYAGDTTYGGSVSPAVNVTLAKAPTATTLTASPTTVTPPASVTLTATVKRTASGASGTPTGSVTFTTGGETLATVKLNASGVAKLTAPSSGYPAGSYPIKAVYGGDSGDSTSTSTAVTVTVK